MPSGQEYANRLREDAHRTLAPQVNDLGQELNNLKNDLSLSLGQLGQRLEDIRNFALPEAESILTEALEEAAHEKDLQLASLAHFAHDIRQKETQEEILDLLLDEAAKVSPRIALFVVRAEQFIGWSSRGFPQRIAEEIRTCTLKQPASPLFQKALESDALTTAADISEETALRFMEEDAPGPWHVFPLKAIGRPVALLLAAAAAGRRCNLESLCILMDLTGMCIENIALKILEELRAQAPQPSPEQAEEPAPVPPEVQGAAPTGGQEPSEEVPAPVAPPSMPAPEPPELREPPEPQFEQPPAATAVAEEWPAEFHRETEPAPLGSVPGPQLFEQPETPEAVPISEAQRLAEEERLHADAKRFARLLVSEIKLYNEQRVLEGRQNKDIYVRLKKDIDRSREMYDKRVPASVSRTIDYFNEELVRILGDSDPSTLGSEYPGPRIGD
jgi:hypothetical protein